ncbi:MAG: tyrosine-type recombinase/integrase [Oscillospiraceae bacterium]
MKTEYLLQREVDLVLAALTVTNRLVMRTALQTGLRVGDVLALRPEQLKPHFWVTEQKTGKKRQVGLPEPLLSDLKNHAGEFWVFPGRDPRKHHTRQAVWKDVKRAAAAFRLPQNVGPHSARKVYAVELLHRYGDIDRVRRALNHGSETVTMIYAMADQQLAAKYRRRRHAAGRKMS